MAGAKAVAALLAAAASVALARTVTINNAAPRLDNTGAIMDAHDCSIRRLPNGTYVMHTIEYGLCKAPTGMGCDQTPDKCGFRRTHNVTVWTSPDLTSGSWESAGYAFALADRPAGLIFRPDAIFNPNTGLWVLWYNQANGGNTYVTSTSPSPFGPFTGFTTTNVTDGTWSGGDFHLFTSGTQGYVVWTGMSGGAGLDHKIRISKLTPDFLSATDDEPYMFAEVFNEAPAVIERNGVWYALFGHCCCFCEQGSGLFVHTASDPMGPWTPSTSPYDAVCEQPQPPQPSNPFCALKQEYNEVTVDLECENGVIDSVTHAFFGTPVGDCPSYAAGACDDPTFQAYATATCVGQSNCTLASQGADPCLGTIKSISAVAHCSAPPGGVSPDGFPGNLRSGGMVGVSAAAGVTPTPGQGCLYGGSTDVSVTRSQQAFVATVPDGKGGSTYLYIGDRWGQSPDGLKGHEPQYVFPLVFEANGTVAHVTWNDSVTFDIAVAGE